MQFKLTVDISYSTIFSSLFNNIHSRQELTLRINDNTFNHHVLSQHRYAAQ